MNSGPSLTLLRASRVLSSSRISISAAARSHPLVTPKFTFSNASAAISPLLNQTGSDSLLSQSIRSSIVDSLVIYCLNNCRTNCWLQIRILGPRDDSCGEEQYCHIFHQIYGPLMITNSSFLAELSYSVESAKRCCFFVEPGFDRCNKLIIPADCYWSIFYYSYQNLDSLKELCIHIVTG